ncbi:probable inactive poly [ADP-ribose] polymerase SRO2 isoform X2 [Hevea brasiliensis]|uniref:probable inactive poly [ADP-ribose] polymerase SRO2 isoform X2 n=1 Tax=Hevea brasiliensis TaxID=3981 RepID=UPI0025F7F96C|nr:probable inactive poly [ADP-ribose] polymerase SRO2 isoform X2 [Hevea brasiliensis]
MLTNQNAQTTKLQKEELEIEDRGSVIVDNDDDETGDAGADNGEAHSGYNNDSFEDFTRNGMVKIGEGTLEHDIIKKTLLEGVGRYAKDTKIVAIHKNSVSGSVGKARWLTFRIFAKAVAERRAGNANLRFAWYGASREEICQVISHGYSQCGETANGQSHGVGISLSPAKFSINSVESSAVDENGQRHILLCRVILGKMETIPAGSMQFQPSSTEFDSGVDNIVEPRRFIVWNAFMNSHIFPDYIISIKAPSFTGMKRNQMRPLRPTSPWMSFPVLLSILSQFLDPSKMALIFKFHDDFKKKKITRLQLIRRVRQISGDELLVHIIRSCKERYNFLCQLSNLRGIIQIYKACDQSI